MPADEYGRSLRGLSVNLLVRDIPNARSPSPVKVLGVEPVYSDPDFAMLRHGPSEWMLHADHTYRDHPLHGSLAADDPRGIGAEIRLHHTDPDAAEAAARARGDPILAGAMDKPARRSGRSSSWTPTAISGPSDRPARIRRLVTCPRRASRPYGLRDGSRSLPGGATRVLLRAYLRGVASTVVHYAAGGAVSSVGRAADS